MARYVLKLPPLPQMGYYQDKDSPLHAVNASHPFQTFQGRSASLGRLGAAAGRPPPAMGVGLGAGGCGGGSVGSSEEDALDGGCLEGLRGRRGRRKAGARAAEQMTLVLEHDTIKFTPPQLAGADAVFGDIIRDDLPLQGDMAPGVEAVCERLVQRLLCAVGAADPRFASKYLVCLDRRPSGEGDGLTLEYLVRLDALSTPSLYPGDPPPPCRVVEGAAQEAVPQGYARLRTHAAATPGPAAGQAAADQWAEFLSPAGFLRRDKVQERFVELLAAAAAPVSSPPVRPANFKPPVGGVPLPTPAPRGPRGPHSPLQVDESRLCGAPGKVVDAALLPDLLAVPADGQLFLASGTDRYPDPRDARIAIVEGSPWVRLRLGLTRDVLVKLVLAVGVDRWPRGSDLPARVPLTHPDCLMYQHAATTGCFLVATGPPPLLRCDDRPCTWQVWAPCAEGALLRHFGPRSAVARALRALLAVRRALALRAVSRHALRSLLLWRLEALDAPQADDDEHMQRWRPASAALHVIAVLDRLVCVLRGASERSYLFPSLHLLSASARQGVPLSEDALLGDAAALAAFLRRLHADCASTAALPKALAGKQGRSGSRASRRRDSEQSWTCWPGEESTSGDCWARLEEALLPAWDVAVRDNAPPAANRSRRLGFRVVPQSGPAAEAAHFTPRQLHYIGALLRGLLQCRALRIEGPSTHSWFPGTMRRHPFATLSSGSSAGTLRSNSSAGSDGKRPQRPPPRPAQPGRGDGSPEANDGAEGVDTVDGAVTADAEDVACIVAVVLEQARTYALARRGSECSQSRSLSGRSPSRSPSRPRRTSSSSGASAASSAAKAGAAEAGRRGRGRRADSVFRRRYNAAVDLLLEEIRSDPGVVVPADDAALVGSVLRWLLASADRAPRPLAAPLRRYLRALAQAAHRTAGLHALWAAARERARDELAAMAAFCRLVDAGRTPPMQGVLEAADKGWEWARWLLRLSARLPGGVHAVLAPTPGRVLRFSLPADSLPARWHHLPAGLRQGLGGLPAGLGGVLGSPASRGSRGSRGSSGSGGGTMTPAVARMYRAVLADDADGAEEDADEEGEAWEPLHGRLRQASPLTALLSQRHRQGIHRAIGDLLPALFAMHKFTLVQEAAWTLPEPMRSEVLDGVARMARETRRRSAARSRITPTSTLRRGGSGPHSDGKQDGPEAQAAEQYRVTDEHHGPAGCWQGWQPPPPADDHEESLTEADRHLEQELRRMKLAESLIGTCRAARTPSQRGVELSSLFDDPTGARDGLGGSGPAAEPATPVHPLHPSATAATADGHYGFLEQTHDRQLRLGPPPGHPGYPTLTTTTTTSRPRTPAKKSDSHKKREALTKL